MTWKWAIAAVAVLVAPVARAHELVCTKTADVTDITTYPTTITYTFTITNALSGATSVATSISDPMFNPITVGFTVPLSLGGGLSATTQVPLTIDSLEECTELGGTPGEGGTVALTNTLTVGFDTPTRYTTCHETVVCHPPGQEGCLTRTPGYWGTHPAVTAEFLPVESCGLSLGETTAHTEGSITEDLCSVGTDHKVYGSPQVAQLVRQCAAAALNIAASESLGGSCTAGSTLFARCCTSCGAPAAGCIEDLDAFNNSGDTLLQGGSEIDLCHALGLSCAAQPSQCQAAKGNGFVNDRSVTAAASSATVVSATTAGTSPTSGGCSGGPGGLLALLGAVGLLALRRR